jgi:hypothetical protein
MDSSSLRRLCSSLACTGGLRQACALGCPSSRAVCITCGLRRPSCIRLAADITLRLAPSCYILQSSCPVNLLLTLQITPVSYSQRLSFRLAPSATLSGRASNGLPACADFPPSARTGDQLQLSSRAAHLARPQCNSWLAPQVTRLWQRRQSNPWLTPVVASFGKAGDQFPALGGCRISGLRRLPAALYFRSLSPSVESWLVFRLAPDSSSLAQLSCDPESRRMLVIWACGLNRAACATRSLSQAFGELSTSTGPCIVG